MKKSFLLIVLSVISLMAFAHQATPQWTGVNNNSPASFNTQLISSSESSIKVNVQVPGFYTTNVTTPRGEAKVISLPKAVNAVNAGEPDLPTLGIPAIIGDHARMSVRIIDAQYMDFEGIEIAPFKGNFSRQIDPADMPYTYGECYSQDAFFPANNVGLYEPYIVRDFRGQNMIVRPFAYNPVTKTLRVYYNMTVEMYKVDDNGVNTMQTTRSNVIKMDPDFKSLYQRHFINYEATMNRYTALDEEGDLLIICYGNFMSAMTDFVNWKKTRGVNTTIVNASTAGSTYSAIQTYIKNQYNANNNLTHVLLVGDVAQIPGYSYSGGGSSYGGKGDNAYGQIVGNDIYNDVFVGRFSATTAAQVTTQCNRVITYERDLNTSATWLNIGSGISRKEGGSGHNNEDDYQHINNIRTDLLNYGYTTVYQRYANLSGYTATSAQISSDINSGVGIINYANHGQETAWGANSSGYVYYAVSHVNALTNENKLPFIWSVACLVGKYDHSSDCFAESWMRATNNNNPTGAIGALMSYISQPWIPPMWAQDECVDILVESYNSNIKHTWGGVSVNGLMGIFDHYSTSEQSAVGTYQAWILYGDPSLMLRTKAPTTMTVTHNGSIEATATSYTVNVTNGNGARATITNANHEILGSATVSNNKAIISLTAPGANSGDLTLCVFGYNKVTYLGTITVGGGGGSTTYYTVSATANPTAGGTISGAGSYASGATCTLTATPASGYEFAKWTKNGTQVSTNATYSFTVNANASYVANFTEVETPGGGTATEVTIGSGSSTNAYLPTYAYYKYSLTEQIYTAAEIGQAGTITAVSFKVGNSKSTTRTVDLYLKHTTKTAFSSKTGWETLSSSDKVYSGDVTFNASGWTTITLSTPFEYNGTSNLIIGMDDNTGSYVSSSSNSPKFYVYSTSANRALRVYSDNTNYNPASPSSYSGTYITSNNQVMLSMNAAGGTPQVNTYTITVSANPTAGGTVTGAGTYDEGTTVTLTATAATGYTFSKWTKNGTQVSTNATYSFTATANAAYVAVFTQNSYAISASASPTAGGTVSGAGTYNYGSTCTLNATVNSGYTFTNWTKNGTQVSTNPSYSFTVTGAASYVANFTQQQTTTYYDVTVVEVPNGTVTANKSTAAAGETVTLTVTPNSNCTFYTWVVYKTGDVNTTVNVNNNSFTMPAYAVTVVAVIKPNGNTGGTGGEVTIGSGSSTNAYLPTYAYYKYSLTEQIYTAAEIGQAGTITAVSFKVGNSKSTTRTVDVYMKHTTKTAFTSKTGWETLSSSDKVYSGSVTFNASGWTTITLSTPFVYNGTSNLVIGMDDNTGSYVSSSSNSPKFYVYSTSANRALRIYSDNTNYNPASPSSYSGTYITSNNQIMLAMAGGGSTGGSTEVLIATPKTMSGFTYVVGNGPSAKQTFAVIGADLSSDITVTAPTGYEISSSLNGTYGTTLTLTGSRGTRGTQTWGFEGTMDNWTTIDKDGDGYNWQLASVLMSGYNISAHGGSDMLSSESYNKTSGAALTPDNWLVSPQVTLGGSFSMYACAQDANYAAEHFGIYVSTSSNTNTSSFVKLGEWTLTAKDDRTQGSWNQYTVDLSAYAGQTGYIAVRHFNCTDQFYLNVDDFTLTYDEAPVNPDPSTGAEFLKANVYVRLKSGLSVGNYNGTATAATTGKTSSVTLNGAVTGSRDLSVEAKGMLDIYPNPVVMGENFRIELPESLDLDEVTMEVYDAVGELVRSEKGFGNATIERSITVAPGIYTVRIVDNKGNAYYGKLVVR